MSSLQRTMSIRSPASSSTMFLMRLPRTPTQAPTRVDPLIGAADGHLAAVARLAGHGLDFDHAVGDFGNLLLEQPLTKCGPRAAENDLHPAAALANFEHRGPHAFVGDGASRRESARCAAGWLRQFLQLNRGGAPFVALHDAGDQLALSVRSIFVVQGVALGFADLLNDDLLGGLGADAADRFFGIERNAVVRAR